MALVVFLRGVNVGGHRTFRPAELARQLSEYGAVNIGAAGTFVVHKPGARTKFRAALARKLPFETEIVLCDGRDLLAVEANNPFPENLPADVVRFVSVFSDTRSRAKPARAGDLASKTGAVPVTLPVFLPREGDWLVRVIASQGQFVFGMYKRHMKTIGYLGQLDKMFGGAATTRNWNTIASVVRVLKKANAE